MVDLFRTLSSQRQETHRNTGLQCIYQVQLSLYRSSVKDISVIAINTSPNSFIYGRKRTQRLRIWQVSWQIEVGKSNNFLIHKKIGLQRSSFLPINRSQELWEQGAILDPFWRVTEFPRRFCNNKKSTNCDMIIAYCFLKILMTKTIQWPLKICRVRFLFDWFNAIQLL